MKANKVDKKPAVPKHGRWKIWLLGFFAGVLNGLFGAGGGMICVPALKMLGLEPKQAHATSLAVIWPLTLGSLLLATVFGKLDWSQIPCVELLVCALFGSTLGGLALRKIQSIWLTRLFGGLLTLSAIWMLCQWQK